jgi:VanZ family protein
VAAVPVSALKRAVGLWGPVLAFMSLIFYLSSQPDVPLPPGVGDKPTHSIAYSILGVLIVRALAGGLPARIGGATALAAIVLTTAYGVSDEVHQMFVPGREADFNDVVADAIGGALGTGLCWLWGIIARARTTVAGRPPHGL